MNLLLFRLVLHPASSIHLSPLKNLNDLDIQTLYPLSESDLSNLFGNADSLRRLRKLALPRNTTDEVIKSLCMNTSLATSLTHLNLSACLSLSNRSILSINKYLSSLEELNMNYNININDFAFIGLSICGIGKSIEWLDHTMINWQFIDDLPIWTYTITHQVPCQCQLPVYVSSACIKLRLKDFNFTVDQHSEHILTMLTEHRLFNEYFHSINQLKRLRSLKLRQCVEITNRLFRFGIRCLPNLKFLDISSCDKVTDEHLSLLSRACPSLEAIDLTGCPRITDQGRRTLRESAQRLTNVDF